MYLGCKSCASSEGRTIFNGRESGEEEGRERGKRKGEGGKRGRMGRLGQDKKWRGGAVLGGGHLGRVVGIRWGGWGAQRWVLGAGA